MLTFHRKKLIVLIVVIFLFLTGCKEQAEAPKTSEPKPEQLIPFQHAIGISNIPSSPKRVVILTNEGTEAFLKLGVKPVGAVNSWVGDPWYEHISREMVGVQPVGFEQDPDIELIRTLKPDLIIGNKMRHEQIYEALSDIAPTVYSETLHSDWSINFTFYSEVLNKKEEGQTVLADWKVRLEGISNLSDPLKEISIVRFMKDHARIYQKDSFAGYIFEELGISRPENQKDTEVAHIPLSKEQISEMDGDLLFYTTYETQSEEEENNEEEWINHPAFINLEVVKAGKAYKVNDSVWHRAGGVLAAEKLVEDLEKVLTQ
ncbi:iron complex transport system substrate-binding protein [Bacillus mesophilus]|uniref:Iron-siderophore ABC transporter substrate-binding protein n=1 Tax=Bacillus mesophilus TaxID=1808955 RepID=A0A6M0Q776_9BACI|nr:iron-siderophore ABC transporter substrate-binding protein [Bacillus mesophilus]MBM7661486.1 iron complex transport system substrate-binding protein [Bacillus mesophilus]NEY72157.1 iron-siderophore ABC transporter substrate-binding protein [Bacillus mesophilus]